MRVLCDVGLCMHVALRCVRGCVHALMYSLRNGPSVPKQAMQAVKAGADTGEDSQSCFPYIHWLLVAYLYFVCSGRPYIHKMGPMDS